jgi:prolyl oligopeptidase
MPVLLLYGAPLWADNASDFRLLLEEAWQQQLKSQPTRASALGDRRYNDQWADRRPDAIERRQAERLAYLARLDALDPGRLEDHDRLNYELFRRELQSDIAAHSFRPHLLPFSHRGGVQTLQNLSRTVPQETVADYEDWLERMGKVGEVIEQEIALADIGRRQGLVAPAVLMQRIPPQIATQLVETGADSPWYAFFEKLPEHFSEDDRQRLQEAAIEQIETVVVPAYRRLLDYFSGTYLPASRESIGLAALPGGAVWYEFLARDYTTTSMTPDEIHTLGLEEVRRIRAEMQLVIEEVGFDGNFAAFLDYLRTDSRFYYEEPEELLEAYRATAKRIDPALVRLFGKLPRTPYGVEAIPATIAPDTTTAYYSPPAADGSRAGTYWVNLYRPDVRPKYEIEVLTVHEAMPGHHLQIALQQELGDMPAFRRYSGFTAFVEGWGLYSESLGHELGLYDDPYSWFGALSYEMWRAVRLVVDTGIHYKGWTREQAIAYFMANAAKTEHDIVNEIDRYIGNPGQALAYKIGQLKILELRAAAEAELGTAFDLRAFHDHLLAAGALPLDMLESRMRAWIATGPAAGPDQAGSGAVDGGSLAVASGSANSRRARTARSAGNASAE